MRRFIISPARIRSCWALWKILSLKDAIKLTMISYPREARVQLFLKPLNLSVEIRPSTSDLPVLRKIFVDQEYTPPWSLAPATILDGGGYIGLSSLYFHHLFPEALIIALEPDPENFAMLEKNTRAIPQIRAVNAALWSSHESQRFLADASAPWASRVGGPPEEGTRSVRCMTLAEVAAMAGGRLDLMKFDIEGAEAEVFRGGDEQILRHARSVVIEFHERFFPGSSKSFMNAIDSLPHVSVEQGENSWFLF